MTTTSVLEVVTPAVERSLLNVDELRAAGITGDDDAVLAIGRAYSARIARICRIVAAGIVTPTLRLESLREVFTIEDDHHYDGHPHSGALVLARRPIAMLASITLNDDALAIDSNLIVDDVQGMLIREPHRIGWWGSRVMWRGNWAHKVTVEYDAGWDDVPEDLVLAAQQLIRDTLARTRREPGLRRLSLPDVSEREYWNDATVGAVSDVVLDMLDPYMNKGVL